MNNCFLITVLCVLAINAQGQSSLVDSCFISTFPDKDFSYSIDIVSVRSADLVEWTGEEWIGGFENANLTIPPATNEVGCRAFFLGGGFGWTGGGEIAAIRVEPPFEFGMTYSLDITYVSHGAGSDGFFDPIIYTSAAPTLNDTVYVTTTTSWG